MGSSSMKLGQLKNKVAADKAAVAEDVSKLQKAEMIPPADELDRNPTIPEPAAESYGNAYLDHPLKGLKLCASLLDIVHNPSELSKLQEEFELLIQQDFVHLCEEDENSTGASTVQKLMGIAEQLEDMIQFPYLSRNYTVAVGGMFSSGKSKFLNTILGCESLLPVDTTPTTAIPTYIVKGDKDGMEALNKFHAKAALDEEGLHAICHAFSEAFGVPFGHILRLVAIERKKLNYSGLTFLDTPGYSKSDALDDEHQIDKNIAKAHLRNADFLIWLTDIENGSFVNSDIDFIMGLEFNNPILFIFNKADKKTPEAIEEIVSKAKKALSANRKIQLYDVIAFSSAENKEYGGRNVLKKFLKDISAKNIGDPILFKTQRIFKQYNDYFESELTRLRSIRKILNELAFGKNVPKDIMSQSEGLASGLKARIDSILQHQKELDGIKRKAEKLIRDIAAGLEVELAEKDAPQIKSLSKEKKASYRCSGTIFKADNIDVASLANVANLKGKVRKLDLGLIVDGEKGFQVLVPTKELSAVTGMDKSMLKQVLIPGKEVTIQMLNTKQCTVIFD